MEDNFIPYEISQELKDYLEFDELCIAYYDDKGKLWRCRGIDIWASIKNSSLKEDSKIVCAPLFPQAFQFFRDKFQLFHEIQVDCTTYPKFCFEIREFVGNPKDLTEMEWGWNKIENDFNEGTVWGLYRHYREAELACLRKLIQICKKKKND